MFRLHVRGDDKKTKRALNEMRSSSMFADLNKYGQMGVQALSRSTPVDTGLARTSWYYRIINNHIGPGIQWYNDDVEGGTPVVILLQYGHATRGGTYVAGYDFINPAMRPVFDRIADETWKKVKQ